jgi:hypothetical protein
MSIRSQQGFTLEATLLIMLLISVLVTIAFAGVLTTVRTANLDYRNSRVFYASEGGAEDIMAQLSDALQDGALSDAELAALKPPVVPGFTVDSFATRKLGGVVKERITDGAFAGLYSLTQRVEIYSSAVDALADRSRVLVAVKAQSVPIFQFGVFFEKDLEVTNGPPMTFGGWVHSNGNIYFSSNNARYKDVVTTPNKAFHDRKDQHGIQNGVYIANASGVDVAVDFDSRTEPTAIGFKAQSNAKFSNRLKTDAYRVDSLRVPLPAGLDPVEVIRPRELNDTPEEQAAKFAWKADWYIELPIDEVSLPGSNLCPKMNSVRTAGKALPSNLTCKSIFTWTWDAFFDARELRYVDVFEIDIDNLTAWGLANLAANNTQVLYVTFTRAPTATQDPQEDGFFPVVRLTNGALIRSGVGLTIATDRPLYVKGDYNSGPNWVPAALVGDGLYILSNAWDDSNARCDGYVRAAATVFGSCPGNPPSFTPWTRPQASATTVNAAILAGHKATPCDHEAAGCPGGYDKFYGGGVENFPRFLERWGSSVTLTYRGSLVSLHESQIATGLWSGDYYEPPRRDWAFETRFENPENLPPGTPVVGNIIHTAFRPVY